MKKNKVVLKNINETKRAASYNRVSSEEQTKECADTSQELGQLGTILGCHHRYHWTSFRDWIRKCEAHARREGMAQK